MKYQFRQLVALTTQMRALQIKLSKAEQERNINVAASIKRDIRPIGERIDKLLPQCEAVLSAEQTNLFKL